MSSKLSVTVASVNNIKALHLYCFDSDSWSDSDMVDLHDALFGFMNPGFGERFISHHIRGGFRNVKHKAGVSKEEATLDLAVVLKSLGVPRLQAFVQVCQFAMPSNPTKQAYAWLVTFLQDANCLIQEHQAEVVFLQGQIGLIAEANHPKKWWWF